jgi:hypothetical protein
MKVIKMKCSSNFYTAKWKEERKSLQALHLDDIHKVDVEEDHHPYMESMALKNKDYHRMQGNGTSGNNAATKTDIG